MAQEDVFKKLVSHCKEYGFVFPSSEIYDGMGAVYDYAQNGVELKNNIKRYWWDSMVRMHQNIVGLDSAIFMHPTIWKASGHVDAFNDPLIDNRDSKKRYRADVLIEEQIAKYDDKIEKEVAKAKKKFGDAFDEAMFKSTNPQVVDYAAKREALHERFSARLDSNTLEQQILDCEREIFLQSGVSAKLFRPPEGALNDQMRAIIRNLGYTNVLWNLDTLDWAHTPPEQIAEYVISNAKNGDIILMHDYIGYNSPTLEALELFVPELLEQGFTFVTVGELLALK